MRDKDTRCPKGLATRLVPAALVLFAFAACQDTEPTAPTPWTPQERALIESLSPIPKVPPSPGNKVADDPKAAALGQAIFFDTGLSANGEVSCATCHLPEKYFTDGLPKAKAVGTTARHTPTLLGAQWAPFVFWDGRKDSLWSQALGPIENPVEHGIDRVALVRGVSERHKKAYEALFGPMPPMDDTTRFPAHARPVEFERAHPHQLAWGMVSADDQASINLAVANIGKAIEAYERLLVPGPAPFDAYVAALKAGDPAGGGHLSDAAVRGLRAFVGKGQCVNCHNGPMLSDHGFHNLGLPPDGMGGESDVGRSLGAAQVLQDPFRCGESLSDAERCDELRFLNPGFEDFLGAFKTPTLRNVAKTAPYMHTGQFATLHDVINFYRVLPDKARVGHRELVLELLDPTVSTSDLVAFLESLTGPLPSANLLTDPGGPLASETP